MIVSHTALETCRRNPRAWVSLQLTAATGGPRLGYDGITKLAIYRFHDVQDREKARLHFKRLIERRGLKTTSQIERAERNLDSYVDWFEEELPVVVTRRFRLKYHLDRGISLGGEMSRIDVDIVREGYRGVIIGEAPENWKSEFRIPLIQRALAAQFKRPEGEFWVGFQNLDGSNLDVVSLPKRQLDQAEAEAKELARQIADERDRRLK